VNDTLRGKVRAKAEQASGNGEVEKRNGNGGPQTVTQFIEQMKGEIARALPRHLNADRLARIMLTEVRRTPLLAQCTPQSFGGAIMTCAQLGLEPGVTGEAYLLPFRNSRKNCYEVQLIIGYQGMVKLFWQSPLARSLDAQTVYAEDDFDYAYGLEPKLVHKPSLKSDRGAVIAWYAVATMTNGGAAFIVMSRSDVEKIRTRSRAKDDGPWKTDYDAMARKGLACDTPIPTPTGWTTMGALEAGDTVFDQDGSPVGVWAVSEIKHKKCYRVTFGNGHSIVCDDEHLWVAKLGRQRYAQFHPYPIAELFAAKATGQTVTIPVAQPIDTAATDLPLDPWLLGYWLGDGTSDRPALTTQDDDLNEVIAAITSAGYEVGAVRHDPRSRAVNVNVRKMGKALAELGVLGNKHVPVQYLRGSVAQRRALLAGLMDSDGWAAGRGRVGFLNTNPALSDAVAELASSLGEVITRWERQYTGYGKTTTGYGVMWTPGVVPFAFSRKSGKVTERTVPTYRRVAQIEEIPSVPTKCIAVDSPTHTFLAGREMVPTHNTAIRQLFKLLPKSAELTRAMGADEGVRSDWSEDAIDVQPDYPDAVAGEVERDEDVTADGERIPQEGGPGDGALPVEDPPEWPDVTKPGEGGKP